MVGLFTFLSIFYKVIRLLLDLNYFHLEYTEVSLYELSVALIIDMTIIKIKFRANMCKQTVQDQIKLVEKNSDQKVYLFVFSAIFMRHVCKWPKSQIESSPVYEDCSNMNASRDIKMYP